MIPTADQKEWRDLIIGVIDPPLKSLSLKLKLASLRANIKIESMTLEEATVALHNYCAANPRMYTKDLNLIFEE